MEELEQGSRGAALSPTPPLLLLSLLPDGRATSLARSGQLSSPFPPPIRVREVVNRTRANENWSGQHGC
jgi:hypothetical protein